MASKTEIDQDYELTSSHHDEGLRVKRRLNRKLYRGTITEYDTDSDSDDDFDEKNYTIKFDDKTKKEQYISRNTLQRHYTICGRKKPYIPRPKNRICKEIADLEKLIKSFPTRGERRWFGGQCDWSPWDDAPTRLQVFEKISTDFKTRLRLMREYCKRDHQRLKKFREKIHFARVVTERKRKERLNILRKSVIQELKHIHNPLFTFHNT